MAPDTLESRLRQQDAHQRLAGMACDTIGCSSCAHLLAELGAARREVAALRRELAAVREGEGR